MTTKGTDNRFRSLTVVGESGTPATPASGDFKLYVADDGTFYVMDDTGTPTAVGGGGFSDPMTTRGDIIIRNASNVTARLGRGSSGQVLTSDGTDIAWQTPSGSSFSPSFLGYNTVGGSTQTMTQKRVYAKQITAGGSGNTLFGIQAYVDQTVEAAMALGFFLHADSGSDTIGDLLVASLSNTIVLAHGTGGGISYPARWFGMPIAYPLAASTKYWIGVVYNSGTGAPRLYYDGSGSDRYYDGGATPYYNDGAYGAGSQTNTSNKHSIRALVA